MFKEAVETDFFQKTKAVLQILTHEECSILDMALLFFLSDLLNKLGTDSLKRTSKNLTFVRTRTVQSWRNNNLTESFSATRRAKFCCESPIASNPR